MDVRPYVNRPPLTYINTNRLMQSPDWEIALSKTGYINEAGRCLVMQATIAARQVVIVLLDSWGKNTRLGDANRIRHWMEAMLATSGAAEREIRPTTPPGGVTAPATPAAPARASGSRRQAG